MLVENDVYDRNVLGNAYRATAAGRYYLRYLADKFSYLDLVCQDTPISDRGTCDTIKEFVSSRELDDRFARVRAFVNYLDVEEEREHQAILTTSESMPLREQLMKHLKRAFEEDVAFITSRKRRKRPNVETTPYTAKT